MKCCGVLHIQTSTRTTVCSRKDFLGQGSFGYVTMVRKKKGIMEGVMFALKSLSKRAVVEAGQVQHIKDEKKVRRLSLTELVVRTEAGITCAVGA